MPNPNPQINRNLEAPPFRIPLYDDAPKNTIMNSTWVRWLQGVYDRVGGSSGGLIYDNATASQDLSSLEPQLYAIKAEIENQFTGILLSIIEQVQEQFSDQSALLQDTSAALLQLVENQNILESGNAGFVQQTIDSLGSLTLDQVLTAGNTSTKAMTTGSHTIQGSGNIELTLNSGPGTQQWLLAYNSTSNVLGFYDATAGAMRLYIDDTTGEVHVETKTHLNDRVIVAYATDTGEDMIVGGSIKTQWGTFVGDGSTLTALNASNITSGTLDAARLASSGTSTGTFHYPSIDVDSKGRITGIATNPVVEYVVAGSGISVSSATGGVTITNTSPSDYRLKQNIEELTDTERFMRIRPVKFEFKDKPGEQVEGFIAHELAEVVPQAVFGEKDGEKMQHISVQQIIPLMSAVIKEQAKEVADLKAELNEIKAILAKINR